jgi:hypothetical protein
MSGCPHRQAVNVNFFLFISVQPRLNDDIPSSDEVIRLKIGMFLNLTVNLISNPTPTTQWIFRRKGFIDQTLQPHSNSNGYKYTSTIYIQTINSTQYGGWLSGLKTCQFSSELLHLNLECRHSIEAGLKWIKRNWHLPLVRADSQTFNAKLVMLLIYYIDHDTCMWCDPG